MVIIITGPTHIGKTLLAQKILEEYKYPYLSIDHLKMGLIRSGNTTLSPCDDNLLVPYLWNIVKEIIKTAIENNQNLVVEGCYVPFDYKNSFDEDYLKDIMFIALSMSSKYIDNNYSKIINHESDIENRLIKEDIDINSLKIENEEFIKGFRKVNEDVVVIDENYDHVISKIIKKIGHKVK